MRSVRLVVTAAVVVLACGVMSPAVALPTTSSTPAVAPALGSNPALGLMCPGSPAPPPLSITNLSRSGADLTWGAVPGAARYGYAIAYLTPSGWTAFPDWTFVPSPVSIRVQADGATAFAYQISAQSYCGTGFAQGSCLGGNPAGGCTRIDLRSRPSAPSSVAAAYSAGVLTVTWSPSADDGGSPITGYQVTASPGGPVCSTSATSCQASLSLPAGTEVTFSVVATTAAGSSDPSPASSAVALLAGPAAPANVKVSATTSTSATLTWTAPSAGDGSTPNRYLVTARPGNRTCQTSALSCRITGLRPGTSYRFEVVSVNGSLTSEPGASEQVRLPQPDLARPSPRPAPRPAPRPSAKPSQNLT